MIRHPPDKSILAGIQIHDFFQIPGEDLAVCFSLKPCVAAAAIQGAHIVGDMERENRQDLFFYGEPICVALPQQGKISFRITQDLIQLHPIQLLRNDSIVGVPLLRQEGALVQSEEHILVGGAVFARNRSIFYDLFQAVRELVFGAPFEFGRVILLFNGQNMLGVSDIVVFTDLAKYF